MRIIALMGPSRGGKSSISQGIAEAITGRVVRLSFADSLKEESVKFGYNYEKTNEQRRILQDVSASMKSEFGEDVFSRATVNKLCELNANADIDYAVIDDLRHSVERSELMYAFHNGLTKAPLLVDIKEPNAEEAWQTALSNHRVLGDEHTWATHRSELEWRGFRHLYPWTHNSKILKDGLDLAVNSVLFHLKNIEKGESHV